MSLTLSIVVWAAALGSGVMAGVYLTFSSFAMKALSRLPREQGIAAMQALNDVILSSSFMPLFFLTVLAGLGLAGYGGLNWSAPASKLLLLAGAIYVLGMFLVTVVGNVPLNDELKELDPSSLGAGEFWRQYLTRWTLWNHVRTLASVIASGLLIVALRIL